MNDPYLGNPDFLKDDLHDIIKNDTKLLPLTHEYA